MDNKKYQKLLNLVIALGILGLLTSLYLVYNHYQGIEKGSACDFSESISCSVVNTSVFSELLNVPVALWGAVWFVFLIWMASKARKMPAILPGLLWWSGAGTVFVAYMVVAEIILKAICPFCTVVHLIVIVILGLSYYLYTHQEHKPHRNEIKKAAKPFIWWFVITVAVILLIFAFTRERTGDYDAVAQCLTDKGLAMYSSFRCGVCVRTKTMFGPSFRYITEIECHPQGPNSQWQLCQQKGIEGTPTWILEPDGWEQDRRVGFQSVEELAAFAGCEDALA